MLALLLFALLLMTAALICMVWGLAWNHRRGRADWSERALARKAPIGAERRRVRPYLRHGAPAPDPQMAHLTVRAAADLHRRLENPWYFAGVSLFLLGNALTLFIRSMDQEGLPVLLWLGLAAFSLAFYLPFHRQTMLDQANLALAINQELAALYEVPDEEPPPLRER